MSSLSYSWWSSPFESRRRRLPCQPQSSPSSTVTPRSESESEFELIRRQRCRQKRQRKQHHSGNYYDKKSSCCEFSMAIGESYHHRSVVNDDVDEHDINNTRGIVVVRSGQRTRRVYQRRTRQQQINDDKENKLSIIMPSRYSSTNSSSSNDAASAVTVTVPSLLLFYLPSAMTIFLAIMIGSATTSNTIQFLPSVEAFSINPCNHHHHPYSTLYPQLSPSSRRLHAEVRKRSGNHHEQQQQQQQQQQQRHHKVVVGGGVGSVQRRSRIKKSNVFEQFTPEYLASPFDVDFRQAASSSAPITNDGAVSLTKKNKIAKGIDGNNGSKSRLVKRSRNITATANGTTDNNTTSSSSNKVNRRLQSLLTDDTGEQEMEMYPDHSPEAAMQLADLKSYSKLNEEARRKASLAVQQSTGDDDDDDGVEDDGDNQGVGNNHDHTKQTKPTSPVKGRSKLVNEKGKKTKSALAGNGESIPTSTTTSAVVGKQRRLIQVEEGHKNGKAASLAMTSINSVSNQSLNKMEISAVSTPPSSLSTTSPTEHLKLQLQRNRGRSAATAATATTTATSTTPTITSGSRSTRVRATVKETGSDSISTYIKSLVQHELLYKEDEILLGRQVRLLSKLEEKRSELEIRFLRPPTFAQWAEATNHTVPSLKQQIRRSQRAKAALIEANLRLVITVARQAVKKSPISSQSSGASSVQFQDACQQGIIGLTRATEKFDPELGFRFSTYAIWWIQKEVARNVSEQSRSVRVPPSAIKKINDIRIQERILMAELGRKPHDEELAERVGMTVEKLNFYQQSAKEVTSLDKKIDARTGKGSMSTGGDGEAGNTMDIFVKDTEQPSPTELIDEQMLKEDIRRLVRTLSPREQAVIRLRFGLDDGKPLGLGDISAKFGVEKDRIKKIEARALLKLRQPSRSQVVKCYVSDHT